MIGALYTLLFGDTGPVVEEPRRETVGGGGRARKQSAYIRDQHTLHGNEAAIRFVIALAISGEE